MGLDLQLVPDYEQAGSCGVGAGHLTRSLARRHAYGVQLDTPVNLICYPPLSLHCQSSVHCVTLTAQFTPVFPLSRSRVLVQVKKRVEQVKI